MEQHGAFLTRAKTRLRRILHHISDLPEWKQAVSKRHQTLLRWQLAQGGLKPQLATEGSVRAKRGSLSIHGT